MSLEAALEENTKALRNLAAVMAGAANITAPAGAAKKPPEVKTPAAPAPAIAAGATATTAAVTYDEVAKPFLKLVEAKGRDAAIAVISPLKALNEVKKGEQSPGQYAALLAKINTALAPAGEASLV